MGMFNFVLDSIKGEIFDFKVKRRVFVASTVIFGYYVNSKCQNTKFEFSKIDYSTSSYHNSTNTGLIDMFFTKKCNYFSRGRRWECLILS